MMNVEFNRLCLYLVLTNHALAAGAGLAFLTQLGIVTLPSAFAPGGSLAVVGAAIEGPAAALQEAGPVDFSTYEIPSFMSAIYEGRYDETGMNAQFRTGYAIRVADSIRQSCRGPFTTAQIRQWETKVARDVLSQATPENGLRQLEGMLRNYMEIYKDPSKLADQYGGMPAAEELPMKAQQDVMTFVQDHTCNGPVFEKFTNNLAEVAAMETIEPENRPKM